MNVFVAGGAGAIGKRLVPQLIAAGHEVTATTRVPAKAQQLSAQGAHPVIVDGLDEAGIMRAVTAAKPEVIIHQETALARFKNMKRWDDEFAQTNRLRTEGLDYLLNAARAAGTRRVIAQSFTGWPNSRDGGPVKTEDDPLDPDPPAAMTKTLAAIRSLEATLIGAADLEGVALRYGNLYGPGTSFGPDGDYPDQIKKRRMPQIGDGAGVWSFTHVDDAARAAVAVLSHSTAGVYNIVDDDPAPVAEWLLYLAQVLGAKPPWHLPLWLGRLATGNVGVSLMTQIRGSNNAKAKRTLGWQPRFPTWRDGFREVFAGVPEPTRELAYR